MKPNLAISLGDPRGIGPEVVAGSLSRATELANVVIFGHLDHFQRVARDGDFNRNMVVSDSPAIPEDGGIHFVHVGPEGRCESSEEAGLSQFLALQGAVNAVLDGQCDCLATGPVSKAAIALVRPGFTGHTEYLAERAGLGRDDVTMVFANERLTVGLVSTHVPMRDVWTTMTRSRYERTARHVDKLLRDLGTGPRATIGIAGFNPHAGEDGLLGTEEREILEPFCREFSTEVRAKLVGPIPADTIYRDAMSGQFDAVVAAYHDQAMIPLKLSGPGQTVNITMGLPFIRTSPDHGTATDIAGKGTADPGGMTNAIEYAIRLCNRAGK